MKEGLRGEALRSALDILRMNGALPQAILLEMLELAAVKPGAEAFAQILTLCGATKLRLDVQAWAKVLGILVQREAPAAQIRTLLNLVLPKDAHPLPVRPPGIDDEEARVLFEDDTAGNTSDREEPSSSRTPAEQLELVMCRAYQEINGKYDLDTEVTSFGRPTYEKKDEPTAMAYYRSCGRESKDTGWYISKSFDSDTIAFNARESRQLPRSGWQVFVGGVRQPDPATFVVPGSSGPSGRILSREEAEKALSRVDLHDLLGMVTHRDACTIAYFSHFCVLAHLEHIAELSSIRQRRQRSSAEQLVRTGWALTGLPVKATFGRRDGGFARKILPGWQDNGTEMVALVLPRGFDQERCRFFRGDCVTLSEQDPLKDRVAEGLVTDVKPMAIVVQLAGKMPEGRGKTWRLDKSANRVVYERQLTALLQIATTGKLPPCSELLVAAKVGDIDSWASEMRSRETSGGGIGGPITTRPSSRSRSRSHGREGRNGRADKNGASRATLIAAEMPRGLDDGELEKAKEEIKSLYDLNKSQRDATQAALTRTCTVIQGPPGTGKTHVSVQVLRLWAKTLGNSGGPLLAASDSNVAVDNIAAGLHSVGVRAVRVGRPEKVRGFLEEITLEAQLQQAKAQKEQEWCKQQKQHLANPSGSDEENGLAGKGKRRPLAGAAPFVPGAWPPGGGGKGGKGTGDLELDHENRRLSKRQDFELEMRILREAEVICTTTISAGGGFLDRLHFAGILIDEVAQATELSAIVPIVLRGSNSLKRLALVGDHCQLPPGIASKEAEMRGLSLSIYSRLQRAGVEPAFLDTQYRSHPKIMEFSSEAFYNGALHCGIEASARPAPRGVPWASDGVPVAFLEVGASEETEGDSKLNSAEAQLVLLLVHQVLSARDLKLADIGIVTPYSAQVRRLRQLLRSLVPPGVDPRTLEIASVDAFQGREKELIIFSAVRSNPSGNMGFLADWRRLNVMLTRARRGLVVLGAAATLRNDPFWQRWLAWCERNGAIKGGARNVSGLAAGAALPGGGPSPGPPPTVGGQPPAARAARSRSQSRSSKRRSRPRSRSGSTSMSISSRSKSRSRSRSSASSRPSRPGATKAARQAARHLWDQAPDSAASQAPVASTALGPPKASRDKSSSGATGSGCARGDVVVVPSSP